MIQLAMSPEEFASTRKVITAPGAVASYVDNGLTGAFTTNSIKGGSISVDYVYDGADQLSLTITGKHGTAHFINEDDIKQRIQTMLGEI